jgi:hypothetical protein
MSEGDAETGPKPPRSPYYRARYVTTLDEGRVELELPDQLSPEGVEDLRRLFVMVLRRFRRQADAAKARDAAGRFW